MPSTARGTVLEQLQIDASQPYHREGARGFWVHIEPTGHAVTFVVREGAVEEDEFTTYVFDEEGDRLVEVGHREGDMVEGPQGGNTAVRGGGGDGVLLWFVPAGCGGAESGQGMSRGDEPGGGRSGGELSRLRDPEGEGRDGERRVHRRRGREE
ncbi:hypothetical protein SVIO_105080 [Streptomyces violaceusniger]|uniref:Uncharacterized protein n=1 Tax=Streptomyces violaceusniger TaxID=68280 RepID=A0A4D4LFX3_STRVO|nr:hypothetical protein SVIO_105080 [Streptomyces violaceusniger]